MLFDEDGNIAEPSGVCAEYDTGSAFPTFSIIRPAIDNTRVGMSPYGQSVFANAIDAVQAVDIAFDAIFNEIRSIRCEFDDSIVTDTAAEKRIAMSEVGVTMHPWEYRVRFFGEDKATAKARAEGLGSGRIAGK